MNIDEKRWSLSTKGSRRWVAGVLGIVALVAAACSSGSSSSPSTTGGGSSSGSSVAAVVLTGSTSHGTVLTTSAGMTLYRFMPDGTGAPTCTGGCATLWPPLTVPSGTMHVASGSGVGAASLGTVTRSDGTLQVTYKGMPLYRYSLDTKGGDANGQGVGNIWFVIPATTTSAPATTPTTAKSSGGYGY